MYTLTDYQTEINRATLNDLAEKLVAIRKKNTYGREVSGFVDALNVIDPSHDLADRVTHIANRIDAGDKDYLKVEA